MFQVESPSVICSNKYIEASYTYERNCVDRSAVPPKVVQENTVYHFRTDKDIPKLGVMLVGWGGNNGSTVTGALIANNLKIEWPTKTGVQAANFYGSLTQSSTVSLGRDHHGHEVFIPMKNLLPMVEPTEIVLDGWDISSLNLGDAMRRAQVFDVTLQEQLYPHMVQLKPRPSIFDINFVAPNQADRANNVLTGSKQEKIKQIRKDIQEFKQRSGADKVIVLWTANTERFCDVVCGVNDSCEALERSINDDHPEVSPSTMFAVSSILEGCGYINGSPQNTFVPGVIELAERNNVFIAGDDFKSGQTKIKSVLVDFLISAGIRPMSIVSYTHLGDNDGKNLDFPLTFESKEFTKRSVVDDMVATNPVLFPSETRPDHCVVIKYIPYVGDSKRAMDEYISEIMMGGRNTIVLHNTCEDSLLASPLMLDLVLLMELFQRITFRTDDEPEYRQMSPILSMLSICMKAPLVPKGAPVVNAFFKQRACLENFLKVCAGLVPDNHMVLEFSHAKTASKKLRNGDLPVATEPAHKRKASTAEVLEIVAALESQTEV